MITAILIYLDQLINNLRSVIDEQVSFGMLVYEVRMLWS